MVRGIGQVPLDEFTPVAVLNVNHESLHSVGSNVPVHDVDSRQNLKGLQGTLFGINTFGGAVVIAGRRPAIELTR